MAGRVKGGGRGSIVVALPIAGQCTHHTPQRIDAGQHGEQLFLFLVCQRCATWPGCLRFAASHLSEVAFQQEATVVDKAQPTTDGPRSVMVDVCPGTPVVAAGGIAEGRGLAAVMMLGAEGVLMGTRFYASQEADGHQDAKRRIVAAEGGQTVRSIVFDLSRRNRWPAPYMGRLLLNAHLERWLGHEDELEARGEEIGRDYAAARARGDFDVAGVIAGEACALIHDIPPAGEIVERIVADAEHLLTRRSAGG